MSKIVKQAGDLRIRTLIHPDSINVRIWEVERLTLATGKYAKPGDTYWANVNEREYTPYTSLEDAERRVKVLQETENE